MSDQKLADGAYPIRVGNREYLACTLTDRDYADLVGYCQHCYVQTAVNASKEMNGDSSELLRFAIASASKITWASRECSEIIGTEDGTLRIGWQMLRKRHPQLGFDEFKEIVKKDEEEFYQQIALAHKILHPIEERKEDVGGSSTENTKSIS